jgi:hypothetical protein
LRESRPLIDHILKEGVGVKGDTIAKKLDAMQVAFDELKDARVGLNLPPAEYRKLGATASRAENAAKAAMGTIASGGHPTAYIIAKGAQSLKGATKAEERRLEHLRGKVVNKPPRNIVGPAIGAVLKGDNIYNENQDD